MNVNFNSGYGRGIVDSLPPVSPLGRTLVVGAATLNNVQQAQQLYKHDTDGSLRMFTTLASAVAGCRTTAPFTSAVSVTASTTADTLTTTAAHGFQNGDKVVLLGTTAPSGTTLGLQYYVVGVSGLTFQVSLQRGGTAIDLTTAGTAVKVSAVMSTSDTIYVLPGHNENVSSSTALNINISGVTIIGLGRGEARPTFYLDTATTALITISAPEVTLRNVIIDGTGFDAIVTMVSVTAPGVTIQGCTLITGNSTNQALLAISTSILADRFTLDSCSIIGSADAGTTNALQLLGGADMVITNNYIHGAYTSSLGPINNITNNLLRMKIDNNILVNATASSTKVIVLVAGSTGTVTNNRLSILSGTAPITGAGLNHVGGNYYTAAAGVTAGTLL